MYKGSVRGERTVFFASSNPSLFTPTTETKYVARILELSYVSVAFVVETVSHLRLDHVNLQDKL